MAAQLCAQSGRYAGVACVGAVIRGETDHYDYVCGESARGIMDVQLRTGVPCAFGVLTVDSLDAGARALRRRQARLRPPRGGGRAGARARRRRAGSASAAARAAPLDAAAPDRRGSRAWPTPTTSSSSASTPPSPRATATRWPPATRPTRPSATPSSRTSRAEEPGAMWQMLTSRATDLEVELVEHGAEGDSGHARWLADYTFTQTGRKVAQRRALEVHVPRRADRRAAGQLQLPRLVAPGARAGRPVPRLGAAGARAASARRRAPGSTSSLDRSGRPSSARGSIRPVGGPEAALLLTLVVHVIGSVVLIWALIAGQDARPDWRGWWRGDDADDPPPAPPEPPGRRGRRAAAAATPSRPRCACASRGGSPSATSARAPAGPRAAPRARPHALSGRRRPARAIGAATLRRRMSRVCHSCGKGPAFGNSRSHSMVATKRRFNPNLQKVRALVDGSPRSASTPARAASRPARSQQGRSSRLRARMPCAADVPAGPDVEPRPLSRCPRRARSRSSSRGGRRSTTSTSSRSPTATRATTWC